MPELVSKSSTAGRLIHPRLVQTLIGLASVLLFGFFLIRSLNFHELKTVIRHARVSLLAWVWIISSSSYMLRALRWQLLLRAEYPITFLPVFWANSAGYLGNTVFPARAGELLRTLMVSGHSGLSKAFVLSTAFAERMADAIALLILAGLVNFFSSALPSTLRPMSAALLGSAFLGALLLAMPRVFERLAGFVVNKILTPGKRGRALELVTDAVTGLRCFHDPGRFTVFLILTSVIWLLDAFGIVIAAHALNLAVPYAIALLLLAALGLSSMVPILPGQIGIFQFVTIAVVAMVNIDRTQGLTYGLVLQAGSFLTIGFWGVIGTWQYRHSAR